MYKVMVRDNMSPVAKDILEASGEIEVVVDNDKATSDPEVLSKIIGEFHGLAIRSGTRVTQEVLKNAHRLKVIGRAGIGVDNIDVPAATKQGIVVMNAPGGNTITTAEHTISLMLALARNIPQGTASLRQGKWDKKKLSGIEITGKTLGIIGCGYIGKTVERLAMSLGMKVLVVEECVFDRFVPLDDMLPQADFITVHVPLTSLTRHMISTKEFNTMKDGVMIVDCSRGGVVDQEALYQALVSGKVKAAALDVFEEEPPRNSKLLTLRNVIATPHIGAQTREAQLRASIQIAEKVIKALEKIAS